MPPDSEGVVGKARLEAFSDGVFAIIITIMVLELRVPHGHDWEDLLVLAPKFAAYLVSFLVLGIYWINHHHLVHTVKHVRGSVLWANLHLLFWLSLFPFATAWMGENPTASAPTVVYGVFLLAAGVAWNVFQVVLLSTQGPDSVLRKTHGRDPKALLSAILYAVAVVVGFWVPPVSQSIYLLVAVLWLIPSRKIEKSLEVEGS